MACPSCEAAISGQPMPPPWRNVQVITSALSGLLLAAGFFGSMLGLSTFLQTSLYLLAVIIGGWYFIREGIETLLKEKQIGIEILMAIAAVTAGLLGQWAEAAMLVFLYSISEAAEGYTEERTRNAIRALMDLAPKTALLLRDNKEMVIPADELKIGDVFIVRPGEAVATDGEIIEGHSSLNQAPVTGESVPVEKNVGDRVFAASLNGEGALSIRVTKTTADNTIARIIRLVKEAQSSKGKSQRFIERFGRRYSPAVLAVGVMLAILPPLFFAQEWYEWLTRATVFIVAAAPCALVISIPITLVAAIGTAGRNGILIKGGVHLENLAKVRVIALDKTGTLTRGKPQVTKIISLRGLTETQLLVTASALELHSQHPLARAIINDAADKNIHVAPADDFQSLTGAGAKGRVYNEMVYIGKPELFAGMGFDLSSIQTQITELQQTGNTVILLGTEQQLQGLIAVMDPLRPDVQETIKQLRQSGIEKIIMLTGDNKLAAQTIAAQAGIDEVFAELSPEGKKCKVEELEREYGRVAMVGDGINDAPALAAAHVGIAMGAAGTDVALETADVALMADDLSRLPYLIHFSHRNWRIIQQNLILSGLVIGSLVIGAVAGVFALPVAVLAHEFSEFVVIASGLRMLRS
ncbi:Lead, cadmium, zinc and mercury transporting ATPase; Copper-translocating P-type ATPase [hydrothermal vent metagenome]|uniref:Lead, cadmium, zinc and mercury transporting ATPase Copper-translocating P-type ATPase n=1 Tax=hydrothermal vent metagenome TaxID=652676 RepID=A0A3B1BJ01_9ZZZZ